MAWLTSDLISDVRRRAMLPTTTLVGTADSDILARATQEMSSRIVPQILACNEEFYVATIDVALVAGQRAYRVPNRSMGGRIREVHLVSGNTLLNLARLEPERLVGYTTNAVGFPNCFYMDAGAVNLVPTPGAGGSLRLYYFVRPGVFTSTAADYGVVTSVSYTNSTTVVLGFSGSLSTSNGVGYDVIAYRPPFEYLAIEGTASASGAGTVTLTSSSLSPNIQVGDYVTKKDLSPIMQLPVELQPWLAQLTACAFLEQLQNLPKLLAAREYARELEAMALKLITPRTDGAPRKMRGLMNSMTLLGTGR